LLFFWHKWNGGGGWNVAFFCLCVRAALCILLLPLNIKKIKSKRQCAAEGMAYKKCDRKKQQKGWRGEQSKDHRSPELLRFIVFLRIVHLLYPK
jgi:hypothetical protein